MSALTASQIEQFIKEGFLRLEGAFPRDIAEACVRLIRQRLGGREAPVIRQASWDAEPFSRAVNTQTLHTAFDQLVGPGRWRPRRNPGLFVVRFPSADDPGDAGWHIDGSFDVDGQWWVNAQSRGRALLMLFLFSDVAEDNAPTRIRVGSHLDVPPVLAPAGEAGVPFEQVVTQLRDVHRRPVALATGKAGDVYLCHPFLVHAASWPHRGVTPRFIAQPELPPATSLQIERSDGKYSPVESAIRIGLGLGGPD
jgi:hypothetical protein